MIPLKKTPSDVKSRSVKSILETVFSGQPPAGTAQGGTSRRCISVSVLSISSGRFPLKKIFSLFLILFRL